MGWLTPYPRPKKGQIVQSTVPYGNAKPCATGGIITGICLKVYRDMGLEWIRIQMDGSNIHQDYTYTPYLWKPL